MGRSAHPGGSYGSSRLAGWSILLDVTRSPALRLLVAALLVGGVAAACTPEGHLDGTGLDITVERSRMRIYGWAWDQDAPTTSIEVHIYVNGQGMAVRADQYRPDVAVARPGAGPYHGYVAYVNVKEGPHEVCAYGINAPGTEGTNALLGCKNVWVHAQPFATTATTTAATTPTTAPSPTSTSTTTTTTAPAPTGPLTWQAEMVDLVNAERAAAGVGQLSRCSSLETAAQRYAATIAGAAWLDHTAPDGSEPWQRTVAYGGTSSGENLAFGFESPATAVAGMLASPTQRENLLRPEFTHLGVGRAQGDPDGTGPAAPGWYWVHELGTAGSC
jgi:uncharacterized protein YkwD